MGAGHNNSGAGGFELAGPFAIVMSPPVAVFIFSLSFPPSGPGQAKAR